MAGLRKKLGIAAAACAATTLLAGAALAGNPNAPGAGKSPAQGGTPPGQAKKGTTANGNGHANKGKALGKAKQAAHPAHPSHPVTPATPSASHKPAFAASKGKGHESTAQHKVIICHRTGSATNPYVVINISINAWLNGHSKHPSLNGNDDILLKDPAAPGEKLPASLCPQGATAPAQQPAAPSGKQLTAVRSVTPLARLLAAGGVKGVSASSPKPATSSPRAGGVLGAISSPAIRAQLPFTGLPLWPAVLIAAALLAAGAVLRRRSQAA